MRERPLILVVDDVPDNIEIVRLRLEAQRYDVITAADGLEALDAGQCASARPRPARWMMPRSGRHRNDPAPEGRYLAAIHSRGHADRAERQEGSRRWS